MTPNEEKLICKLNRELSETVQITLYETEHEINGAFKKFCEKLSQLVPKIKVVREDGDSQIGPQIGIGNCIRYQAVPTDNELEPFLEALKPEYDRSGTTPETWVTDLIDIQLPAILQVFVAPQCKYCPQVVRQLLQLTGINSNIHVTVVDCTQFPAAMQANNIQSVPTVIMDERFRWTGAIDLGEVINMMKGRDGSALSAASLEMMIANGNAGQLARMMIDEGKIFQAVYEVLTHYSLPVRLGAMVAMEELIGERPELAGLAISPLWEKFGAVSETVQGDILYLLGEVGHPDAKERLEAVLNGDFSAEVKEAADEALAKIKNHA
jgi:alkyl hydroperoxide reductase subunit AhpF